MMCYASWGHLVPCIPLVNRRFGILFCLDIQGRSEDKQSKGVTTVDMCLTLLPWRWKQNVCFKRRWNPTRLYGVTSQKTAFFRKRIVHAEYLLRYLVNHFVMFQRRRPWWLGRLAVRWHEENEDLYPMNELNAISTPEPPPPHRTGRRKRNHQHITWNEHLVTGSHL
jgi:hypothetical protein